MTRRFPLSLAPGAAFACLTLVNLTLAAVPATAASADGLSLGFGTVMDGRATTVSLVNDGTAATTQRIVSSGGGSLAIAASATGTTGAVQFPAYTTGSATAPRAVVAVTNSGATDALDPGAGSFAFGADVRLDATSSGTTLDNGNNVVQRGLYDATSQYKLQVDGGTASCRVLGAAGSVQVGLTVPSLAWVRLTCAVTAASGATPATVTISAAPVAGDGTLGVVRTVARSGRIGALSFALATPLSVGGKLTNAGTLAQSADQLNGRVDNAWWRVG